MYILGRATLTAFGENCAASLAAGDRGALGLWSAVAAARVGAWPAEPQLLVVGGGLDLDGVGVHRTRSLSAEEVVTNLTGIRATAWPRTLTDLAEYASVAELQTVLDKLERSGLLNEAVLHQAIRDANGRRGLTKLHTALEPFTTITAADYRSLLERFSAMLLEAHDLPPHEINGPVTLPDGRTIHVDILFRGERLAVEIDGRDSHDRSLQFNDDRYRDRELQKLGFRTLRFAWQDVMHRPHTVIGDICALLRGRAPRAAH